MTTGATGPSNIPQAPTIVISGGGSKAQKVYAWDGSKKVLATNLKKGWLNLTPEEQQSVTQYALSQGKKASAASTVWGELVNASAASYASGLQKSPWQVLQDNMGAASTSYTNVTKQDYDVAAQTAAIHNSFVKLAGRMASPEEVQQIINVANAQAGTKTTTTYSPTGTTTEVAPAQTPEQIAQSTILTSPEYKPERERQQNLQFSSWLNTAMTGGQNTAGGLLNG